MHVNSSWIGFYIVIYSTFLGIVFCVGGAIIEDVAAISR